jgi:hypothetical protein
MIYMTFCWFISMATFNFFHPTMVFSVLIPMIFDSGAIPYIQRKIQEFWKLSSDEIIPRNYASFLVCDWNIRGHLPTR